MPNTIAGLIEACLEMANATEVRLMHAGDLSVAVWLAEHVDPTLTASQAESVAFRLLETLTITKGAKR